MGKDCAVYINDVLTMFGSRSECIAKLKKTSNRVIGSPCMIHQEALSSKTVLIAIKDKLTTFIEAVNYVKASFVNTKLFTKLCKEINSNYETLHFHTSVWWLSKFEQLARMYEITNKLMLFFEAIRNKIFFCQSNQKNFI